MKAKILEAFLLQSKFAFSCCLDKKDHEEVMATGKPWMKLFQIMSHCFTARFQYNQTLPDMLKSQRYPKDPQFPHPQT